MKSNKIKGLLLLVVIIIQVFVLIFINIDFKDTKALETTENEDIAGEKVSAYSNSKNSVYFTNGTIRNTVESTTTT